MASLLLAEEKLTLQPFPGRKDIIYTISEMLVVQHLGSLNTGMKFDEIVMHVHVQIL